MYSTSTLKIRHCRSYDASVLCMAGLALEIEKKAPRCHKNNTTMLGSVDLHQKDREDGTSTLQRQQCNARTWAPQPEA